MNTQKLVKLVVALALPLLVGVLGSLVTIDAIPNWYAGLEKPFFNPPNWLFGPVWTILYVLMGIALFIVWQKPATRKKAYIAFGVQLILNLAWSYLFFGAHALLAALVEILILVVAIVWTMKEFYNTSRSAAWLLLPYLGWVSFATLLTAAIYILNR